MSLRALRLLVLAAPMVAAPGALLAQPAPAPPSSQSQSQTPTPAPQTPTPQAQTPPQPPSQSTPQTAPQSGSVAEDEVRRRSGSAAAEMLRTGRLNPDLTLRCRPELGTAQLVCTESSLLRPSRRPVESTTLLGASVSLYTANNLATKDSTTKFLRSVTGNSTLANKVAPTFMRLSKSAPARYGLAIAVIGSGALVVYEYLGGDGGQAEAKPVEGGASYVVPSGAFRKIGEFDANGVFREAPPAKAP